ncbi:outer membrane beta-barrel protein [Burkholderiaceae bacterium DAT-1]|nr:outer membrane beta-barrel protein [Burkholderiaceae bacterium DAT-1]
MDVKNLNMRTSCVAVLAAFASVVAFADNAEQQPGQAAAKGKASYERNAAARAPEFETTGQQSAAAFAAGPVFITPSLTLQAGHNDNLTGAVAGAEVSTNVLSVAPAATADLTVDGDRYSLQYSGSFVKYASSSADNFNMNNLLLQAQNVFSSRLSSTSTAGVLYTVDPRGSNQSGPTTEPNRYRQGSLSADVVYGAEGADGRLQFSANTVNKRYLNNRTVTEVQDRDATTIDGKFFYRVAPKTQAFVELGRTNFRYRQSAVTQDTHEDKAMVGVTWEATASTAGTFKIGSANKKFESGKASGREDFSGVSWEGAVRWTPLSYTTVDVNTARATADSTGVGDYLVNKSLGATWTHSWNTFVSSRVGANRTNTEFVRGGREDTVKQTVLGVDYKIQRWLKAGVDYTHEKRDSSDVNSPYTKNVFMVSLTGTL